MKGALESAQARLAQSPNHEDRQPRLLEFVAIVKDHPSEQFFPSTLFKALCLPCRSRRRWSSPGPAAHSGQERRSRTGFHLRGELDGRGDQRRSSGRGVSRVQPNRGSLPKPPRGVKSLPVRRLVK